MNVTPQNERLKKLKVLAERGVGGEKENAQILLERLCDKYHISQDEIESSDKREMRWFRHKRGDRFVKLLCQCIYKTLGKKHKKYTHGKVSEIGVECTAAEGIEIELDYAFYSDALETELERFLEMFIQKNDIFPKTDGKDDDSNNDNKKITVEDILLYQGIKKQTRVLQISGENDI